MPTPTHFTWTYWFDIGKTLSCIPSLHNNQIPPKKSYVSTRNEDSYPVLCITPSTLSSCTQVSSSAMTNNLCLETNIFKTQLILGLAAFWQFQNKAFIKIYKQEKLPHWLLVRLAMSSSSTIASPTTHLESESTTGIFVGKFSFLTLSNMPLC